MPMTTTTSKRPAAWLALTLAAAFAALLVAAHLLMPEYIPARHTLSQYALGPVGWILPAAFVCLAGSVVSLGYALVVELGAASGSRWGAFLLLLAGFCFVFVALFPADPGDAAASVGGKLHAFTLNLGIWTFLVGALLVSRQMSALGDRVGVILIFVAWMVEFWARGAAEGLAGLPQRVLFGVFVVWLGWVAGFVARYRPLAGD